MFDHMTAVGGVARRQRNQSGFSLALVIGLMLFFSLTLVALLTFTLTTRKASVTTSNRSEQLRAADGALESVASRLRMDYFGARASAGDPPAEACAYTETTPIAETIRGPQSGRYFFLADAVLPNGTTQTVVVTCETIAYQDSHREVELVALTGATATGNSFTGGTESGSARIQLVDQVGGLDRPGIEMVMCDWQLGRQDVPLAACPPPP